MGGGGFLSGVNKDGDLKPIEDVRAVKAKNPGTAQAGNQCAIWMKIPKNKKYQALQAKLYSPPPRCKILYVYWGWRWLATTL